jgi:hypothetical protein
MKAARQISFAGAPEGASELFAFLFNGDAL